MNNYFNVHQIFPQVLGITIAVVPFIIAKYISKKIFDGIIARTHDVSRHTALLFISKSIDFTILILGVLTLLGTLGFDVRALLAGLGLTGFALGYALKEVLENIIAGIILIFYKPIEINSYISLLEAKGKVISIDLRYTTIQDGNHLHLIPNSKLISEKVTILTK